MMNNNKELLSLERWLIDQSSVAIAKCIISYDALEDVTRITSLVTFNNGKGWTDKSERNGDHESDVGIQIASIKKAFGYSNEAINELKKS